MMLVDTIVCVECGKREYSESKGKSARTQNGVCDKCQLSFSWHSKEDSDAKAAPKSAGK